MITKRWQIFWPPVSDPRDIQLTIWGGCFAAFFYAAIYGVGVLFGLVAIIIGNLDAIGKILEPVIRSTIAAAIGWGVYKKFRAAPVAGLVLSAYFFIGTSLSRGSFDTIAIIMVVDAWLFIHATRGIFAYHKIRKYTQREKTSGV
jgi:hypothetical protein